MIRLDDGTNRTTIGFGRRLIIVFFWTIAQFFFLVIDLPSGAVHEYVHAVYVRLLPLGEQFMYIVHAACVYP